MLIETQVFCNLVDSKLSQALLGSFKAMLMSSNSLLRSCVVFESLIHLKYTHIQQQLLGVLQDQLEKYHDVYHL